MKHFLIKFNHGVEIGARLAYNGHWKRTDDFKVFCIACDEARHKETLERMLTLLGEEPEPIIDGFFMMVGGIISRLCQFCPLWSLNLVARTMEMFAIFNYRKLAKAYPQWASNFEEMALKEEAHRDYFKNPKPEYLQRKQALPG